MSLITVLCANPCIDKTLQLSEVLPGGTNRVQKTIRSVGGKGINVAASAKNLGLAVRCLYFSHEESGSAVASFLQEKGIEGQSVPVAGRLRENIKIFEQKTKQLTEFNENGDPLTEADAKKMLTLATEALKDSDIFVLSGSIPPGIPAELYAEIIAQANFRGVRTILDTDGEAMFQGIRAIPFLLKPNKPELGRIFGRPLSSSGEIAIAAKHLLDEGIAYVCASMGSDGALLACRDGIFLCGALDVPVKGTVGTGDSMVAGICKALIEGGEPEKILIYGCAAAHASVIHEGTTPCTKADFEKFIPELTVIKL
ncbi:MAG TPA: 1-phosphofructokinase family hexose kinase [Oscillospiraceae bacterium]|nr:1-phosphofructokinase family hexose kinase [Oscillospiraceae bacterium]